MFSQPSSAEPNNEFVWVSEKPVLWVNGVEPFPIVYMPLVTKAEVPVLTLRLIVVRLLPEKKKGEKKASSAKASEDKKQDGASEFAQAFQTQSLYIFPLMLGYLSYSFPIGLSLYWNTFTLFGILQQYQISGWGALGPWIPGKKK